MDLACNHSQPINPTDQSGSEDSKKGHSWTWHGITHNLSSQQDQSGSEDSEKGHSWIWHGITHTLSSQQDQSGSGTVRSDRAGPDMESLTSCQVNSTRVGVGQ